MKHPIFQFNITTYNINKIDSPIIPIMQYYNTWDRTKEENEIINLLDSSFRSDSDSDDNFKTLSYVTQLIAEIEEMISKKGSGIAWGNEMASVTMDYEYATVYSNLDSGQGDIPTSEILQLLKDWKVFLEEFYARAWGIPLDWVKPEKLEEAKKMHYPNGS